MSDCEKRIKVSVIIPVYNGEKTLTVCIESLLTQTLQEIELIFVNDCSTDHTQMILELIRERFPQKLRVITLDQNRGAGGARNVGIEAARGEYLGFVDADDAAAPTMFEKLYTEAKKYDYDIVDGGFYKESEDRAIVFTGDELTGALDDAKRSELIVAGGYICTKIFRTSFWRAQQLAFRENVILEDSEIVAKAIATANSVGNVKEVLYLYKNTAGSSSKQADFYKYYYNCYEAMKTIYEKLSVLKNYEGIRQAVEYEMLQMYAYALVALVQGYRNKSVKDAKESMRRLAEFRRQNITPGYENRYVKNKMKPADIEIMKQNDKDPTLLLK